MCRLVVFIVFLMVLCWVNSCSMCLVLVCMWVWVILVCMLIDFSFIFIVKWFGIIVWLVLFFISRCGCEGMVLVWFYVGVIVVSVVDNSNVFSSFMWYFLFG